MACMISFYEMPISFNLHENVCSQILPMILATFACTIDTKQQGKEGVINCFNGEQMHVFYFDKNKPLNPAQVGIGTRIP